MNWFRPALPAFVLTFEYMHIVIFFLIVLHFIAPAENDVALYLEAPWSTAACPCSLPLVADTHWFDEPYSFDFELDLQGPVGPPFLRQALLEEGHTAAQCNNEQRRTHRRWMALRLLQPEEPQTWFLLRRLWRPLGGGHCSTGQIAEEQPTLPPTSRSPSADTESTLTRSRSGKRTPKSSSKRSWKRSSQIEKRESSCGREGLSLPVICYPFKLDYKYHSLPEHFQSEHFESCARIPHQRGDPGSPPRGLPGQRDAAGCQSFSGEGPGQPEEISHQGTALCHQGVGPGIQEAFRCHPGEAEAPQSMDAASGGIHPTLAIAAYELQKTAGRASGRSQTGSEGCVGSSSVYQRAECASRPSQECSSYLACSSHQRCAGPHWRSGCRRRGNAEEDASSSRAVRWYSRGGGWIWIISFIQESGRYAGHFERRGQHGFETQACSVRRTHIVTIGSAHWCPEVNQYHEPDFLQSRWLGAEAYDLSDLEDCAACSSTLPFTHSVEFEPDYKNPWRALCNAWALRHQVIQESETMQLSGSPWQWRQLNSSFLSTRWRSQKKSITFDDQVHWRFVDDSNQLCGWQVVRLSGPSELNNFDFEDIDDSCSFMARRPVPSTPSSATGASDLEIHEPTSPSSGSAQDANSVWRSVQIYDLHSGHARGRVQIRPPELYFIHTRRLLGYTHHQVAQIFGVTPPPDDLAALHVHPLLLVCHDDILFGDHRRAVLLDLELHGVGADAIIDTDRYTTLIPQQVHRELLLDIAGVAPYCRMQRSRCLVWLRGNLLSAASNSLVTVQHGDYVRIATPPFEDPVIPTQFAVRACQAGLTRSQLIHHFRRIGTNEDDLFSEIEAAQQVPQPVASDDLEVDDASLLQLSTSGFWTQFDSAALTPLVCRSEGESQAPLQLERSLPGAFRNHEDARAHHVLPSWTADMHEAFTDHAAIEFDDEGPIGYVDTWFLTGHRAYVTEESRVFRADQHFEFWQNEIAELWRDRLNLNLPLHFHWVRPTPKALATRDRIGHLLLLQDPDPSFVPTLVTIDMIGHQRAAFGFAAALLSNPIELFQVRDLLQLARHCLDRRCELKWFDLLWRPGHPLQVPPGAGLQFVVMPPIFLTHLGSDHEVGSTIPIATTLPEEPAAPAHPPLEAHSEFVRILHASWLALATPGPGGIEFVLRIQTWYLESGFVRHHDDCRDVVLGEDFWNWEIAISSRWADFVLPDSDLEFHLALPAPPTAANANEIHIILAQRLREFECASLVTTYDNAVLRGTPYTAAIILPAAVLQEEVVRAAGKHLVCPPHAPASTCSCWHGGRQLPFGARYPNRNGYSFILIVHRPLPPNFWDGDAEGSEAVSFLQTHCGRRLTTGPVAQTQWPSDAHPAKEQVIDLHGPIVAFEVFDSHFFLTDFVFETIDPAHPAAQWILDWWDFATPSSEIWIYYDGSAKATLDGTSVTAAAAAFVKIHHDWFFAGAISTPLPFGQNSYSAEHYASGDWSQTWI